MTPSSCSCWNHYSPFSRLLAISHFFFNIKNKSLESPLFGGGRESASAKQQSQYLMLGMVVFRDEFSYYEFYIIYSQPQKRKWSKFRSARTWFLWTEAEANPEAVLCFRFWECLYLLLEPINRGRGRCDWKTQCISAL